MLKCIEGRIHNGGSGGRAGFASMDIKFGHVCDRGLNPRRPVNQDRYFVDARHGIFAVFDGVGGQKAGEIASQTAADTIEEALALENSPATEDRIRGAIQFANRDIFELASSESAYETMATTVALLQISDHSATIAHVGDSRVYRLENGQLQQETIDHTDFDDRVRAGLIRHGQAVNDSHVINRALGSGPDVDVEIKAIDLTHDTRFLVCTDGIYRMLQEDEIAEVLGGQEDPQKAADELRRMTHERGADDNLTAVVVYATKIGKEGRKDRKQQRQRAAERTGPTEASNKINVELGRTRTAPPGYLSADPEPAPSGHISIWILLLVGLVLLTGGFYLGLRLSDRFNKPEPAVAGGKTVDQQVEQARRALEKGDLLTAEGLLSKRLAEQPNDARASYWLGRALMTEGRLQDSIKSFETAIANDPALLDAYLQAAGAYQSLGEKSKAVEMLGRYTEALRKAQPPPAPHN